MGFDSRRIAAMAALAVAAYAAAGPAQAQEAHASGQVRRVDAAAGKVAIRHDAIADLGLPAMTLVYQADPRLLAGIEAGDEVSFTAVRRDGKYVVTAISK